MGRDSLGKGRGLAPKQTVTPKQPKESTMNAIIIEHVKVEELPPAWRAKLSAVTSAQGTGHVTVRIEAEIIYP